MRKKMGKNGKKKGKVVDYCLEREKKKKDRAKKKKKRHDWHAHGLALSWLTRRERMTSACP